MQRKTRRPAKRSRGAGAKTTISERALFEARAGIARLMRIGTGTPIGDRVKPFEPRALLHPPGVTDAVKAADLAMDEALAGIGQLTGWAQAEFARGLFGASHEGMVFLGYPELAVLAQRPEYRVVSETLATEMTRKWIRFAGKDSPGSEDADEEQAERIELLKEYFEGLDVEGMFRRLVTQDGFFGRSHLYIDTGDTEDREELLKPLGNGHGQDAKVNQQKPLRALRTVEAVWTYPTDYNSNDPLRGDWYNPTTWFVMGKRVDSTRLLRYVGREVPDMLKPAYSFGGLSLTQMLKPYVDNWLRTRQSVADIISSFSVFVLKTDLMESLNAGGSEMFKRAELFNLLRDNMGVMLIDMDSEDFTNVAASLATLDVLQAQTQEHMAAVARIPIVKLLGIQPAGLNADSEGIMRAFYDSISAEQKKLNAPLGVIFRLAQLSLWGKVDPGIKHEWEPLLEMSEKEQAEVDKARAETDETLIGAGVLHPEESRKRIANDPATRYSGLDVEDVPDPIEQGPEPENVHEKLEGEAPAEGDDPEAQEGADDDIVVPFAADAALKSALDDAGWQESEHPRDADGKFSHSATGGSGNVMKPAMKAAGFQQHGKTGSGKPTYLHPGSLAKIVIEPSGKAHSSKWTLYENAAMSQPHEIHKGEGAPALQAKLKDLGHSVGEVPTKAKGEASPSKGAEPAKPTETQSTPVPAKPSEPEKKTPSLTFANAVWKYAGYFGNVEMYESKAGSKIAYHPGTGDWSYSPGKGIKKPKQSGNGTSSMKAKLNITALGGEEAGEPAKKAEPNAKWNAAAQEASKLGLTMTSSSSAKTQKYESPKGTVEIDPETGEWLAVSPGHITKKGNGLADLEALYAGKPGAFANAPGQTELYPTEKPKPAAPPPKPVSAPTALQNELKKVAPEPTSTEAHALGVYGGSGYQHINDKLRNSAGSAISDVTKALDQYLAKAEIPKDVVLYRKVGGAYAQFLKSIIVNGTVFADHGYSSSSTHPGTWHGELHFVINVPKGMKAASIAKYSGHGSENEVLLPRGTVFKVTSFDHSAGKAHLDIVQGGFEVQTKTGDALPKEAPEDAEPVDMTEEESERYTWHEGDLVILEQPSEEAAE